MRTLIRTAAVAVALMAVPATARAEWFAFPFTTLNTGGDTTRESGAFGGSFGWMGKWYGAEGEVAWAPSFFDDEDGFRTRHQATTFSGTGLFGPRIGTWRPYGAIGFGVMKSEIAEVGDLASVDDERPALNLGGGLMWSGSDRFGLRGDIRYIRATDDEEANGNVFDERLANFSYWRVGAGVTIRW